MDEQKRKKFVYVIFVAAVIYGLFNLRGRPKTMDDETSPEMTAPVAATSAAGTSMDSLKTSVFEWSRDPFAYTSRRTGSGSRQETKGPSFKLSAISEANGNLMAIINGELLSQGETIAGWTISRLTTSTATLSLDGRDIALRIGQ